MLLRHNSADSFMANLVYSTLRCTWSCCTTDALHRSSIHNSQLTVVHVTYYRQRRQLAGRESRRTHALPNHLQPSTSPSDHVTHDDVIIISLTLLTILVWCAHAMLQKRKCCHHSSSCLIHTCERGCLLKKYDVY